MINNLIFLNTVLTQWIILAAVVIIFLVSVILNRKTQTPKDTKLPEKCQFCPSNSCIIRISDVEKLKSELKNAEVKEYMNNCEEKKQNYEAK